MSLVAITRAPSASLAHCELTHVERTPIDLDRARAQHAGYCDALRALGVDVVTLPALDELPDATFVEDVALVLDEVAWITRPGAESRRAECEPMADVLARHRELERLVAPCTLDGGDVLRVDDVLYVGQSTRTNHAALKALAHGVLAHGMRVKAVEVRSALHLKSACTHLGGGVLLAQADALNLERVRGFEVLEIDPREPGAANVLRIGDALLMPSEFPRTMERVERKGHRVTPIALSEFLKAEAGVTCLSLVFEARRG